MRVLAPRQLCGRRKRYCRWHHHSKDGVKLRHVIINVRDLLRRHRKPLSKAAGEGVAGLSSPWLGRSRARRYRTEIWTQKERLFPSSLG